MRTTLLLAACALLAPGQPAERLTAVNVSVEDPDGAPVEGLTAADFSLQVDQRSVALVKVTHQSSGLSLAVVLDLTASGFWPGGGSGAKAAAQIVSDHVLANLPADTSVLVGSFGRAVRWAGGFSQDRAEQIRRLRSAAALPEAERTGPSPLWDAVDASLSMLQERGGRRAVLLVTDGQATGNRLPLDQVADRAIADAVPIHIVFTGASGIIRQTRETAAAVHPDRALVRLAAATGGSYAARPARSIEAAPVDALRRVSRGMRSVYRVEFTAPVTADFQQLTVTMRDPRHHARAPVGFKNTPGRAP